jgi:sRNA-binding protein
MYTEEELDKDVIRAEFIDMSDDVRQGLIDAVPSYHRTVTLAYVHGSEHDASTLRRLADLAQSLQVEWDQQPESIRQGTSVYMSGYAVVRHSTRTELIGHVVDQIWAERVAANQEEQAAAEQAERLRQLEEELAAAKEQAQRDIQEILNPSF